MFAYNKSLQSPYFQGLKLHYYGKTTQIGGSYSLNVIPKRDMIILEVNNSNEIYYWIKASREVINPDELIQIFLI